MMSPEPTCVISDSKNGLLDGLNDRAVFDLIFIKNKLIQYPLKTIYSTTPHQKLIVDVTVGGFETQIVCLKGLNAINT